MDKEITLKLPITETYREFVSKTKNKKIEGVYRISFECGSFYIGRTSNFYGRIYNHVTLSDNNNCKNLSPKQKRMLMAINQKEYVKFEMLTNNERMERNIISKNKANELCLNISNGH